MLINTDKVRSYDVGLILTTLVAVSLFLLVAFHLSPSAVTEERFSQLAYLVEDGNGSKEGPSLDFSTILDVSDSRWTPTTSPVNLGMSENVHWFRLTVSPTQHMQGRFLLQLDYPLLDELDMAVYSHLGTLPTSRYTAGDTIEFDRRPIHYPTPLIPLPVSQFSQHVYIRIKTSGTIRLPLRVWEEREFVEYSSSRNLALGLFFGFLCAMGLSNVFLFLTTKRPAFLFYSGYVFSLGLTLASLQGIGYAYLWHDFIWFQGVAVVVFANATIFFAAIFTRTILQVKEHSVWLDNAIKALALFFGLSALASFLVPYSLVIKVYLVALCLTVLFTISLGVWMSVKGVIIARYFTIAWASLLVSGLAASLDNVNLIDIPLSSNNLLIIGGAVETLMLAFILAISYSHSRDDLIEAQQFALDKEIQANNAKEDLLAVQQRYQDDLEYKVQERTLELEITLRELSEVNEELERLTGVDPLTGINNRRHFDKRLKSEGRRSRREQTPLSLIIIDVDHFKTVNDKFGHAGGDACLMHVSSLFKQLLHRPTDDLCRIGGEEFAIILPNTNSEGACHVAELLRQSTEQKPVDFEGQQIALTISAGVATAVIESEEHALALFRDADEKLYAAKDAGRNRVSH